MSEQTLGELRAALDAIDREIMERIGLRLGICRRVAEHKRQHGIPMMQPDRVAAVKARVASLATAHDVHPEFAVVLYELIIAEACRLEDAIMAGGCPQAAATADCEPDQTSLPGQRASVTRVSR